MTTEILARQVALGRLRGKDTTERLRDAIRMRRAEREAAHKAEGHAAWAGLRMGFLDDSTEAMHRGIADYCRAQVDALGFHARGYIAELRQTKDLAALERPVLTRAEVAEAATTGGTGGIIALVYRKIGGAK